MDIPVTDRFAFQAQELPQKLNQVLEETLTGYWRCELLRFDRKRRIEPFYVGLLKGRVVCSGQQISWQTLLEVLQRYIPRFRNEAVHSLLAVRQELSLTSQSTKPTGLPELFEECYRLNLISPQEVSEAMRLKILADFDTYLFDYPGQAQFIPSFHLGDQVPIAGFNLRELLIEAKQRQVWWNKLQTQIPSMSCVPVLNQRAVQASNLTPEQKQRLESLTSMGKSLDELAIAFAQDSLEIAKVFAKLMSEGLLTLTSSTHSSKVPPAVHSRATPEILVVDDSPLLLKQFENLVTRWGYQVNTSINPETVIEKMLDIHPAIVFLDINMPGISGFDLVKQIRRCPEFTTIPLIILTAEKTLTNNWRARWSGCRFLSKPLAASEVSQFQMELRLLLEEMVPLPASGFTRPAYQSENHYQLRDSSV
ncbi:response regulator [Thermocoleostomius sinensis]|uniref:Response regulator n=1 Tax=Thermocoleostomius sinensis A174 TaxID=2016057 RepID=A0A9E8ZEI9_9CYAN|nr:response regulator [Thermocoleostomius sinensis]WAL61900.1 response regulator [Thermocoleostomius sinensis A174]